MEEQGGAISEVQRQRESKRRHRDADSSFKGCEGPDCLETQRPHERLASARRHLQRC